MGEDKGSPQPSTSDGKGAPVGAKGSGATGGTRKKRATNKPLIEGIRPGAYTHLKGVGK